LREQDRSPVPEPKNRALWEVVAGLVEAHESGPEDPSMAAARELLEEAGFHANPEDMQTLGPSSFPAPGVIAERHFFFHVEVDPHRQSRPPLDGSPLEEAGELIAVPLFVALDAARDGRLADAKTELALRRFSEYLEHSR
jgi:ADP-ribose pyrophosphatase